MTFSAINENELQNTADYFNKACIQYGDSVKSVSWYNRETQKLRFLLLTGIAPLSDQSILDIGCGLGDFYQFLNEKKIPCQYEGIDISQKLLNLAKKKHPKVLFNLQNFFDPDFTKTYDYVVSSGAFNIKVKHPNTYIKEAIEQMVKKAEKGVAFNLLSSHTPNELKNERMFNYYAPDGILNLCLTFSKKVVLLHNYLPNDFTVYIYI